MRLDYKNSAHSENCLVLTNQIVKKTLFHDPSVQAGCRLPAFNGHRFFIVKHIPADRVSSVNFFAPATANCVQLPPTNRS